MARNAGGGGTTWMPYCVYLPSTLANMAKIRHIAIRCEDVDKTAAFFQAAFGLQFVQRRGSGPIDLTDGDVNITLLPLSLPAAGREVQPGFEHIGFSVEDEAETRQRLIEQGATELNPINLGDAYYEAKYRSAEGLIVDVGHWAGTSPIEAVSNQPSAVSR